MKLKDQIALMGKRVQFSAIMSRYKTDVDVTWHTTPCGPTVGWVVGFRYVMDGVYYDDETGRYLKETGRHLAVLVSTWPTKSPIRVPKGNVVLADEAAELINPYKKQWSEENRTLLREAMQDVKRDKKGRWLKG